MSKNDLQRIIENAVFNLQGIEFQDFCDRLRHVLYPNDFTPVRAGGPNGDLKNDGYCPKARIFFAAFGTRGEELSKIKSKAASDLKGCVKNFPDMKKWVFLCNDTQTGEVEHYFDQTLRPMYQKIDLETWGPDKISKQIAAQKEDDVIYVLGFNPFNDEKNSKTKKTDQITQLPRNISSFEQLLSQSTWSKRFIGQDEIWVCDEDEMYQITKEAESERFTEPWTQVYPDKTGSFKHSVYLKIFGVTVEEVLFITCDGGRIGVPLPDVKMSGNDVVYYWKKDSLKYKLGKIIGSFYIYGNMEGVAAMSKLQIVS